MRRHTVTGLYGAGDMPPGHAELEAPSGDTGDSASAFMMVRLAGIAVALICASCTLHRAVPDPLCGEIARFAMTVPDETVHEVALFTSWGGPLAEANDSIRYKRCVHGGLGPEKQLCNYLMENTSTEFARHNVQRALVCLNTPAARRYLGKDAEVSQLRVTSRTAKFLANRAIVAVTYSAADEVMRISVQRLALHGRKPLP